MSDDSTNKDSTKTTIDSITDKLRDMGIAALFGFVAGVGLVFNPDRGPGPQEIDTMTCGNESNPVVQRDLAVIEENFVRRSEMSGEVNRKFEIWGNKDSTATDRSVVVARFPDGQVCYAPVPQPVKP